MIVVPVKSNKYGNISFFIDGEDFDKIKEYTWGVNYNKNADSFYIKTNKRLDINKRTVILLHRLIMNYPKNMVIDHINGNTLDNRKENLRVCTIGENSCNCKKYSNGKLSKFKGVSFDKNVKKYKAYIKKNRKYIHLGYFMTEKEASEAYDVASKKYHGEYSKTNYKLQKEN